jgi:putative aldouronate transport system permease protein
MVRRIRGMRETKSEKIFSIINIVLMILLCAAMLYPVLYVLGRSLMTDVERAARPFSVIPKAIDFEGYKYIFMPGSYVIHAYGVTILRAIVGTFVNMVFTAMFAYVLSIREYPLRGFLTAMVIFTMWFSGGLIPNFLLIKSLKLTGSFWVYIIPGLISAWNMLILRNFFMQIPYGVQESAKIDGANDIQIFVKVVLPLSAPALATISLFYGVYHWNAWFDALIYVSKKSLWPIQVFLREIVRSASIVDITNISAIMEHRPPAETVVLATIVVATVPILCVYPFVQKYFVKGMMVGSLKG